MTNTAHPTGIEAIVCADIARRQALGIAKYGTTVADNPLTLREWLMHAYEEKLDAAVYLRRAIAEIDRKQEGHAIERVNVAPRARMHPVRAESAERGHYKGNERDQGQQQDREAAKA